MSSLAWAKAPWETVSNEIFDNDHSFQISLKKSLLGGKSTKVYCKDIAANNSTIGSRSSTELSNISDSTYDLVITDPPFGGLLHYSELSDFFFVWLRLLLKK